jgi:hypothetical protein
MTNDFALVYNHYRTFLHYHNFKTGDYASVFPLLARRGLG